MKKNEMRFRQVELKMRVACSNDATLLKAMLEPNLAYWDEFTLTGTSPGQPSMRREIEFGMKAGTLSRAEVWTVLGLVPGCGLAQETLAPAWSFTGQRVHPDFADTLPTLPDRRHIAEMLDALTRAREGMLMQMARTQRLATRLSRLAANEEVVSPAHALASPASNRASSSVSSESR